MTHTTTASTLYIPQDDFARLRALAAALPRRSADTPTLLDELDRATVLARELLPPGVVTVHSRVRFQDTASGTTEEYVLTWPDRADAGAQRLSVLAPIGTALLGCVEGDEVTWPTPGGTRRLRILEVSPVPENELNTAGDDFVARLLNGLR